MDKRETKRGRKRIDVRSRLRTWFWLSVRVDTRVNMEECTLIVVEPRVASLLPFPQEVSGNGCSRLPFFRSW